MGTFITEIMEKSMLLLNGKEIKADMVLVSTGVRPDTELASAAGIELGAAGANGTFINESCNCYL